MILRYDIYIYLLFIDMIHHCILCILFNVLIVHNRLHVGDKYLIHSMVQCLSIDLSSHRSRQWLWLPSHLSSCISMFYYVLMMSWLKNRFDYCFLCRSSAAVVTVHTLPTATWKMAPITQVFMIYVSAAITVFSDFNPQRSLLSRMNGHIPSKKQRNKVKGWKKKKSNTSQQQDLFDQKVIVEIILWWD